jgi:AraC-like DNA-binding protein
MVDQLMRTSGYRDFERAFRDMTGLALRLRPIEASAGPPRAGPCENPFCAVRASGHPVSAACRPRAGAETEVAGVPVRTLECFAGLAESVLPVRHGPQLIGYLHTGPFLRRRSSRAEFARALARLTPAGTAADRKRLAQAWLRARVLAEPQQAVVLRLLAAFVRQLAALSVQCVVPETRPDPPAIARAKAFIAEHQHEDLTLSAVAQAVNTSAFYFCKMFKQATGLTYTDYLAHMRVERVQQRLRDEDQPVSQAAFAAGFQSLSQFNRVFRRVAGEAPTVYRARVRQAATA